MAKLYSADELRGLYNDDIGPSRDLQILTEHRAGTMTHAYDTSGALPPPTFAGPSSPMHPTNVAHSLSVWIGILILMGVAFFIVLKWDGVSAMMSGQYVRAVELPAHVGTDTKRVVDASAEEVTS